jgi:hypothetical protein
MILALQTNQGEKIADLISSLPDGWKVTYASGKIKNKKDLMRCIWGTEKE